MGIERKHDVSKDGNVIRRMYQLDLPYEHQICFESVADAIKLVELFERGIFTTYTDATGADAEPKDDTSYDPSMRSIKMLVGTVDDEVHGYDHYSCDHHIVKDSDVCGVSKCYQTLRVRTGRELHEKGWKVLHVDDKTIVTCPLCVARVAEAEDTEVDRVDDVMVYSMWKMEQEVIERNG